VYLDCCGVVRNAKKKGWVTRRKKARFLKNKNEKDEKVN